MKKLLLPLLLTALQAVAADLLIVVESTLDTRVTPSLDQYIADAKAEGWNVETVKWPARSNKDTLGHVRLAEQVIWPRAKATTDLHVMMIGKLPMPYSGFNLLPDGHTDTVGAYATTLYYACPDAKWTDIRDNSGYKSKAQFINRPGDGKFDQQVGPGGTSAASIEMGKLQAKIGFLDMSVMGNAKSWGSTNTVVDLQANAYIQYFQRNHDYRTGQWSPKTGAGNGAYTKKPTGYFQDWAYRTLGTNDYYFFFAPTASATQPYAACDMGPYSVVYDFKALPYQSTYWSTLKGPWAVLDLSYGSYQIDFGAQRLVNPLVTGALATANSATGAWDLTGMFQGKTLGQLWGQTVNRGMANTYCVLYGDPTIVVRKPGNSAQPVAPVAVITPSAVVGMAPLSVSFDGSSSYDADGSVVTYDWNFGDGHTAQGAIVNHAYTQAGTYTAVLTITDDSGLSHSESLTIEVASPNVPPVAQFSVNTTSGTAPLAVVFDATSSTDSDGQIVTYTWDFGDGNTAAGETVQHSFVNAGTYQVNLSILDNRGGVSVASTTIVVEAVEQQILRIETIITRTVETSTGTTAYALVRVTTPSGSPISGIAVTGRWTGIASNNKTLTTDVNGQVEIASKKVITEGTLTFSITRMLLENYTYDPSLNEVSTATVVVSALDFGVQESASL